MTTTEPQDKNAAPNKDQAEQTPTWSLAEEMFPLHASTTEAEAAEVFARRSEWERLTRENAELRAGHDTFVEVVKQRHACEMRNLRRFTVALKVVQQLLPVTGETEVQIKHSSEEVQICFNMKLCSFTVRVEDDTVYLDMVSKQRDIKPVTLQIDDDGLSGVNMLGVQGYLTLGADMPLPARAKGDLIQPHPLGSMMRSMIHAGIFGVSSLSFSRPGAQRKGCGMPGCPSCGGRS